MARQTVTPTNLEVFSGNTKVLQVTVKDCDEVVVDITGATASFVISKRHGKAAIVTKTIGSGIVVIDAVNGVLEVTLDPADTEPLAGAYAYELKITDATGRQTTVLFGTISFRLNSV